MTSRRERARRLGVSEAMLRRHEAAGTIWPEADGTWDEAATRERLDAAQNPAREALEAVGQPRVGRGVLAEPTPIKAMAFNQARAMVETIKARRAEVELARLEGRLLDVAEADAAIDEIAGSIRDAILNWPARVSGLIAAEIGVDQHALQEALDKHVGELLHDSADRFAPRGVGPRG